jgi:hypothetical protein
MNINQKRSFYTLLIWGIITAVFIPIFFINGGPRTWVIDSTRTITVSIVFIVGYISYFTMLGLTRKKKSGVVEMDERDIQISRKASEITTIVLTGYVFFTCVILYVTYYNSNSIPVGWMWFLGFTCFFVGYIANSTISLILYNSKVYLQ